MALRGNEIVKGFKIRAYDNGGKTADRYTVVYMDSYTHRSGNKFFDCLGMDSNPFHPMGIGMHGEACIGAHLGKRVSLFDLPQDCIDAVVNDLIESTSPAIP